MRYVIFFPQFAVQNLVSESSGVGHLLNKRGFSVESSLQGISSKEIVVVKKEKMVCSNLYVIWTQQRCGQRLCMSAGSKRRALAFYFSEIKMQKRVRSRSVHNVGTRKNNAAASCRLPIKQHVWTQNLSEIGTAQRHSLGKSRNCALTYI